LIDRPSPDGRGLKLNTDAGEILIYIARHPTGVD